MNHRQSYVGIHNDLYGGMTDTGRIILDAWVFGLISQTETCEGWDIGQIETLYAKVHAAWAPYGHLASHLPPGLRAKHELIYAEAVSRARELGWSSELGDEDE